MTDPFETVAFLANSENRVRILEALADGPQSRADLAEETGIARATLGRILTDLEDRGWVTPDGQQYTTTPRGTHLVREFRDTLDAVAAIAEIGDLLAYFPEQRVPFDVARLRNATVTRPGRQDSTAPVRQGAAGLRSADHVTSLTGVYAPPAIEAHHAAVTEDEQSLESVFAADAVEAMVADPDVADLLRELLTHDGVVIYRYPGEVPYNMGLFDERATIGLSDDRGAPQALVETDDPVVCEWVRSKVSEYRAEATRLGPGDVPAD